MRTFLLIVVFVVASVATNLAYDWWKNHRSAAKTVPAKARQAQQPVRAKVSHYCR